MDYDDILKKIETIKHNLDTIYSLNDICFGLFDDLEREVYAQKLLETKKEDYLGY